MLNQLRERQRGSVSSRSDQSLDDGLVELRGSSTSEELVELNQESNVGVSGLGLLSSWSASSATTLKINSHGILSYEGEINGIKNIKKDGHKKAQSLVIEQKKSPAERVRKKPSTWRCLAVSLLRH